MTAARSAKGMEAALRAAGYRLTPHINLICNRCGKIQDLAEPLPLSPEYLAAKEGFQVMDYRMEYYGLCPACQGRIKNQHSATNPKKGDQHEQP